MKCAIRFESGEHQGRQFEVLPARTLAVGRSSSNDVKVGAPDVSGKHIVLRYAPNGYLAAEVLSSHVTTVNGTPRKLGDQLELRNGDRVTLGSQVTFSVLLENADAARTLVGASPEETVVPSAEKTQISAPPVAGKREAAPAPGDEETIALMTQMPDASEIERIREKVALQRRKKLALRVVPAILFFVFAVTLFIVLRPAYEQTLSWPRKLSGGEAGVEIALLYPATAGSYYPDIPASKIEKTDNGYVVYSKIGSRADVDLRIVGTREQSKDFLTLSREEHYRRWLERLHDDRKSPVNWGQRRWQTFISASSGSGVPVMVIDYTRRTGDTDWFGYAAFMRWRDWVFTVMAEVPASEQGRAEPLLRGNITDASGFVAFEGVNLPAWWDGADIPLGTRSAKDELALANEYMEHTSSAFWGKRFLVLRRALIKAVQTDDQETLSAAEAALRELRREQGLWYGKQKLALQDAKRRDRKSEVEVLQNAAEAAFTAEFRDTDFRYDAIRRKVWE